MKHPGSFLSCLSFHSSLVQGAFGFPACSCFIYQKRNDTPRDVCGLALPVVHTQRQPSHVSTVTIRSAEAQIWIVPKCRETCSKATALKPSEGANSWLKYLLWITSDFLLHKQVSKDWFLKYQRTQQVTILWPLRDKNKTEYQEYLH